VQRYSECLVPCKGWKGDTKDLLLFLVSWFFLWFLGFCSFFRYWRSVSSSKAVKWFVVRWKGGETR
jgi:hypothetical protein